MKSLINLFTFAACGLFSGVLVAAAESESVRYQPNWESLDKRPTPAWFDEARFGIMVCWGPYSVPAWAPKGEYAEWYWNCVKNKVRGFDKFHEKNYGADFDYREFGKMMRGELFNPDAWADLFVRSGAKYVVMTANYHDSFCLWPSPFSKGWNAADIGPKRDVLGEVTRAVRKRGLKMGIYYSLYEWFHPLWLTDRPRYVAEHFHPQFKDVVTRYKPAFIFADGEWEGNDKLFRSEELLAWLFNDSPCKDEVVVNDRWGNSRRKHGTVFESEYGGGNMPPTHPWQEDRGIGASYGYNRNEDLEDYNTRGQLLQMLAKCAGNGGNLLLNVGPAADGHIPVIMQERLVQIGQWLKSNGESIYGTKASPFWPRRYAWGTCTRKPGKLFLHIYGKPVGEIAIGGLRNKVEKVYWLADPERAIATRQDKDGTLFLRMPECLPDPDVSVAVAAIAGEPDVDLSVHQQADGLVILRASEAIIHGLSPGYESQGGKDAIGYWHNPKDSVSWDFQVDRPGDFTVSITYSCDAGCEGSQCVVAVDGQSLTLVSKKTGSWTKYASETLGNVRLPKTGKYTLRVAPQTPPPWKVVGLKSVVLTPLKP